MPFPDELEHGVVITPYRPEWPSDYDLLAAELHDALGSSVVDIEHIGSTSVPGMAAKDCIDVQVLVRVLDDSIHEALDRIGFRLRPEAWNRVDVCDGVPYPRMVFAPPVGGRSCNVHVRPYDAPSRRLPLLFRDFLRANGSARDAWSEFKIRLAGSATDIYAYGQIKQPATMILFETAERWADRVGWSPDSGRGRAPAGGLPGSGQSTGPWPA